MSKKSKEKTLLPRFNEFDSFPEIAFDETIKRNVEWRFPRLFTRRRPTKKMLEDGRQSALGFWEIGYDGAHLITRWGQIDGKGDPQTSATRVNLNNSGRTMIEQALLQGRRKYNNKIKEKDATPDQELAVVPIEPTLAYTYEAKDWKRAKRWLATPKIDGGRMLVRRTIDPEGNKVITYMTRKKRAIPNMEHMDEEFNALFDLLPEGTTIDCEANLPGEPFQLFISFFRSQTKQRGTERVKGTILDIILPDNDMTFWDRHQMLNDIYKQALGQNYVGRTIKKKGQEPYIEYVPRTVSVLPVHEVASPEAVTALHDIFCSIGYEGLILRNADMMYEFGRTHSLLKVKSWLDDEGPIVDITEGEGKMKGKAIFHVEDKNGNIFAVTMAATMEQREEWFNNRAALIGQLLTYKYFEETDDGIPRFPVGIAIRNYE